MIEYVHVSFFYCFDRYISKISYQTIEANKNGKLRYLLTQHTLLLVGYVYYSEPVTPLDLLKEDFFLFCKSALHSFNFLSFSSVLKRHDSRKESELVNKSGCTCNWSPKSQIVCMRIYNFCPELLSSKNQNTFGQLSAFSLYNSFSQRDR